MEILRIFLVLLTLIRAYNFSPLANTAKIHRRAYPGVRNALIDIVNWLDESALMNGIDDFNDNRISWKTIIANDISVVLNSWGRDVHSPVYPYINPQIPCSLDWQQQTLIEVQFYAPHMNLLDFCGLPLNQMEVAENRLQFNHLKHEFSIRERLVVGLATQDALLGWLSRDRRGRAPGMWSERNYTTALTTVCPDAPSFQVEARRKTFVIFARQVVS